LPPSRGSDRHWLKHEGIIVTKIEMQALEIERLKRREMELVAQLTSTYSIAAVEIEKASVSHCTGSGVLLRIFALGGREIIAPVVIRDGLSLETIGCLIADIKRSHALAISY
jgi:hypothetical protein